MIREEEQQDKVIRFVEEKMLPPAVRKYIENFEWSAGLEADRRDDWSFAHRYLVASIALTNFHQLFFSLPEEERPDPLVLQRELCLEVSRFEQRVSDLPEPDRRCFYLVLTHVLTLPSQDIEKLLKIEDDQDDQAVFKEFKKLWTKYGKLIGRDRKKPRKHNPPKYSEHVKLQDRLKSQGKPATIRVICGKLHRGFKKSKPEQQRRIIGATKKGMERCRKNQRKSGQKMAKGTNKK